MLSQSLDLCLDYNCVGFCDLDGFCTCGCVWACKRMYSWKREFFVNVWGWTHWHSCCRCFRWSVKCAFVPTHTHTHKHTDTCNTYADIHAPIYTYIFIHACTHIRTKSFTQRANTNKCTYTCPLSCTQKAYKHTWTHRNKHMHDDAHVPSRTCMCASTRKQ